jgi:hypothetical protein
MIREADRSAKSKDPYSLCAVQIAYGSSDHKPRPCLHALEGTVLRPVSPIFLRELPAAALAMFAEEWSFDSAEPCGRAWLDCAQDDKL